jgi:hypothetical protein
MLSVNKGMTAVRTSRRASSAGNTFVGVKGEAFADLLRFGVVAPNTFQRTTLKKHNRPYSGTIVNTESLNIKNLSFHINSNASFC